MGMRSITLLLAVFFITNGVFAQEESRSLPPYVVAEKLFERGKLFLGFGDHDKAIDALQRAYAIYHDEKFVLWLARTYDQKEDYENAIRAYNEYLDFGVLASGREAVVARLEEIRTRTSFGKELVTVTVDPPDAQVFLDDVSPFFRVKPPCQVFVPWGTHKWIVKRDDFVAREVPFVVEKGAPQQVALHLSRVEFFVEAVLQSTPAAADVYLDGKAVGKTPVTVKVKEGYYTVRMISDGLPPFEKLIAFTREADNTVAADLEGGRLKSGTVVAETAVKGPDQPDALVGGLAGGAGGGDKGAGDKGKGGDQGGGAKADGGGAPTIYRVAQPTRFWKISGYSLLGTGLAGLIAGGVFAGLGALDVASANKLDPFKLGQAAYDKQLAAKKDSASGRFKVANIAFIAGGAATAVGAGLLVVHFLQPKASPIAVVPSVTPAGAGMALQLEF
jgi:hypothetical protein